MLAKLVILLFYNSLQNQERWFRYSVWFAMFVTVGVSFRFYNFILLLLLTR
jgi:hypothetical protein